MGQLRKGKKISKNFKIKKLIKNPIELLSLKGESVYVTKWNRTISVSWILSMQTKQVLKFTLNKSFYTIERI